MITFSVGLLEKQDIELNGVEPPSILELEDDLMFNANEDISYELLVRKVSSGALITGRAHTRLSGACGRCLEETIVELSSGELELFVELDGEEIVDITEDIRAELLINLPANLLCSDDCEGLCPVCGGNLNKISCSCEYDRKEEKDDEKDSGEPSPWDALDKLKFDK